MDDLRVYTGTLIADLILAHARSKKDRRKPLQALVQRLRNRGFAVAQVGPSDLNQRVFLAVTAVAGGEGRLAEWLDAAERIIFASDFDVAELRREVSVYSAPVSWS
jgi:uncharacterized protein YlxP (DUF503 family)